MKTYSVIVNETVTYAVELEDIIVNQFGEN